MSTANDEAIARAIAESEGHLQTGDASPAPTAPPHIASAPNCPGNHGLELFQASKSQCVTCNGCRRRIEAGGKVWSCVRCNFDCCEPCYQSGNIRSFASAAQNGASVRAVPSPTQNFSPPSQFNNPFAAIQQPSSHMCLIPCQIGGRPVEMLVDTGAQSSVLSMPLVNQLGLANRLDRRYQGVAAGVGRAKISGSIRNVVCTFGVGHVEFPMSFIVLEVQDPLVILGLDQMRKYQCHVDLERDKLIFGGTGGVEVDMLPPNQAHIDLRSLGGCVLM
ncbi:hypothetical protein ACHAXT_004417 [Thalassiosira profunda]